MTAFRRRFDPDLRPVGPPRVAVIGPCGAGKSTLVNALRDAGVDAHVTAQEHSMIPDLWSRKHPDLLLYLDVDFETVRARRGGSWLPAIHAAQIERLASARKQADLELSTVVLTADETALRALELIAEWRSAMALAPESADGFC